MERAGRPLTIERLCASPSLCGPAPNGLKLAPDGKTVSYLKGRSTNKDFKDLWAMDVTTQAHSVLVDADWLSIDPLSDEEKSRRERLRVGDASGIMDYDWSADSCQILIPAGAKIYMYTLSAGGSAGLRELSIPGGSACTDVRFSPQSSYVSFVRDQNVFVYDVGRATLSALTHDGGGVIKNGMAEFVAQARP
jgi:dipeptidyl-peptidase-4